MNNASLDIKNKQKSRIEYFMEFCALPPTQIAEVPLSLFPLLNKCFERTFKWLSDGPISEWMSDLRHYHPKAYWGTSIIWIPIFLVVGFYLIDILFICGISAVVFVIGLAIALTAICKIIHIVNIIINCKK